ncbi:MAG: dienelactone hydrolase family protein [Candidatus Eisenbacteria bacterium]|uniref:Dienelactone hydrolase family protein n=1 Tax=Eiseniibacteriota bacterium TaxID=2212470 RepID=A0A7Y2E6K0_UNCEI|nr:dienelactone hydrolase family protein [Candidatus Eisenbacteria bacterium]
MSGDTPMDSRITKLYNDYIHGDMPRRVFFMRVTEIAGSTAAAAGILTLLEPDWAHGQQVAPSDERLVAKTITYPGATGPVQGYLARPANATGKLPGVLVIHENRGLNKHIEDVARRAALAGYVTLAPDGLSYVGGGLDDQEAARDRFSQADRNKITADVIEGVTYLAENENCTGSVGTVGFCYGGGVALQCAVNKEAVAAAVCFYGRALGGEDIAKLSTPIMMHYAGSDERINAGIPEFLSSLDEHAVAYSMNMYPDVGHGFHNDTSQARYNAEAAGLAWRRTLAFFKDSLV